MAELVVGVLGLVVQVAKYVVAPIQHQFVYIFRLDANNRRLRKAATKLDNATNERQQQVNDARRNTEVITPEVNSWLQDANEIQTKVQSIQSEISVVQQNGCFTSCSHYSLSKKTVKITDEINELLQKSTFSQVANPAKPVAEVPILIDETPKFPSREVIENQVLEALKEDNLVGICGMPGVGKTTLAEKLMNVALQQGIFKERVKVTVSQKVELKRIQIEIAKDLGIKNMEDTMSHNEIVNRLKNRLTGSRVLIVIDDIWEDFKLLDIGIQLNSTSCTILVTSRNWDVLDKMKARILVVDTLTPDEAWSLFEDKAGRCIADPDIMPLAKEVARECHGLPIALVTVGSALYNEDKHTWKDALKQLQNSINTPLNPLHPEVYPQLRLSYNFLKDEEPKSLFLLCCTFPEDFDIDIEELTFYGVGLNMFKKVDTLCEARDRVHRLVAKLKKRSLLLDGKETNHVRMHDVVRDVARFIASDKGLIDEKIESGGHPDGSCEWISKFAKSREDVAHFMGCKFPNLHLLLINFEKGQRLEIDPLLEEAKSLNVLSLRGISSSLLDKAMNLPATLQTLHLVNCNVRSISLVGELPNLEILICHNCEMIEELPIQIGELTRLKLLHLTECRNLRRIVPRVLSNLVNLEELHVLKSFNGWEATEDEGTNASLQELALLTKLNRLSIQISNLNLSKEEIRFPGNLEKYIIQFGKGWDAINWAWERPWQFTFFRVASRNNKLVKLEGVNQTNDIARWLLKLVWKAEELHVWECGSKNIMHLFESAYQNVEIISRLNVLTIGECGNMEELFPSKESREDGRCVIQFQNLKKMKLYNLPNLTTFGKDIKRIEFPMLEEMEICNTPKLRSLVFMDRHNPDRQSFHCLFNNQAKFDNLQRLIIFECGSFKGLFPFSIANSLVKLTTLFITNCKDMDTIIMDENEKHENFVNMKNESKKDEGTSYPIKFPKLVKLWLEGLPRLMTFCTSGIECIDFLSLKELKIKNCPKFKYMITSSGRENGYNLHNDGDNESLHLWCNKKVKFDNLQNLFIAGCAPVNNLWCQHISPSFFNKLESLEIQHVDNIRGLFPFSIANSLVTLTRLNISECEDMEAVIVDEKEMHENITDMKNESENDGETSNQITFPNLVELVPGDLPRLMTFDTREIEHINFSSLKELSIRNCPKFKHMITSSESEDRHNLHNDGDNESLHLFCNKKVKFGELKILKLIGFNRVSNIFCEQFPSYILKSLESLYICECNNIMSLFSTSIVQELGNLRSLSIDGCKQMEKVIVEGKEKNKNFPLAFPDLKYLHLLELPVLHCVFNGTLQLPLLDTLEIESCPRMEFLTSKILCTPKLWLALMNGIPHFVRNLHETMDLNTFIRQHITSKEKELTSYESGDEMWTDENEDDDSKVQPTLDDNDALDATILDGGDALDSTIMTNEEASIENLEVDKRFHTKKKRAKSW